MRSIASAAFCSSPSRLFQRAFAPRAAAVSFSSLVVPRRVSINNSPPSPTTLLNMASQPSSSFSTSGKDILASFSQPQVGNNVEGAMEALANADAVCFDVDSTVIMEEGIDVLGDYLGKGKEIETLTRNAMEGSQKFEDALQARLDLLRPSKQSILDCLQQTPLQLSPGIESLIESLIENQVDVYLVSGGFRIMIEPLARQLCVAKDHIYANTILFDEDTGDYRGFDADEPTSRDMGKPRALELIKSKHGYETMVMVGDGATDAQAKPPADAFIGYGGVVVRDVVKDKACWFVTSFDDLETIVEKYGKSRSS